MIVEVLLTTGVSGCKGLLVLVVVDDKGKLALHTISSHGQHELHAMLSLMLLAPLTVC